MWRLFTGLLNVAFELRKLFSVECWEEDCDVEESDGSLF
jgi:hypothetical protein